MDKIDSPEINKSKKRFSTLIQRLDNGFVRLYKNHNFTIDINLPIHFTITVTLLLLSVALFEWTSVDFFLAQFSYDFTQHKWLVDRNNPILRFVFYDGIKVLFAVLILFLIGLWGLSWRHPKAKAFRKRLTIVILSCILVPATVGILKGETHIPCPKNLQEFDGHYPHITLLTSYPKNFKYRKDIRCYPAGHASGGFALLSLFFLFGTIKNRKRAIYFALGIGWSTGCYKMLIGDHFFTHTLTSMILAWLIILMIYSSTKLLATLNAKIIKN